MVPKTFQNLNEYKQLSKTLKLIDFRSFFIAGFVQTNCGKWIRIKVSISFPDPQHCHLFAITFYLEVKMKN